MHCSRTHKFYFLATFSFKMGPTVLFTHLKVILLQYFSVFSFSFQFLAVSKRTLYRPRRKTKTPGHYFFNTFFFFFLIFATCHHYLPPLYSQVFFFFEIKLYSKYKLSTWPYGKATIIIIIIYSTV